MCDPFTVAETEVQRKVQAHLRNHGLTVTNTPTLDLAVIICRAIADTVDAPYARHVGATLRASLPAASVSVVTTKGS